MSSGLLKPITGVAGVFSYDAVEPTPRRKHPSADLRTEDEVLFGYQRDTLVSTARDAKRNFSVAAWMVRKHLDFVSDFSFKANTPDRQFNLQLEKYVRRRSLRQFAHVARRHPLRRLMRMAEAGRTLDGDIVWELLKDRSVNLIRGDRIRNPFGYANTDEWKSGVRVNVRTGAPLGYQVHTRTRGGAFRPDKFLPAANALHHGYFDDAEQVRGVSPMSTAINNLRDTYEGIDFALARLKAEMIIGFAITKEPSDDVNPFSGNQQFDECVDDLDDDATDEEWDAAQQARANQESKRGLVKYGKGLFQIEMNPGEDMKAIAGNMPSSNAANFIDVCIHLAMKSLDIPFSFYREDFTNFYGSRGALQLYKRSCQHKQADNQELLDELTEWWVREAIIAGELELPRGIKLDDLEWQWVPRGIPWWDRSKEVIGDIRAIAAGLDTPQNVVLEHDSGAGSFEGNVDQIAEAIQYAKSKLDPLGVALNFTVPPGTDAASSGDKKPQKGQDA